MVLEFLKAFGELFDLKDEFPEGITLGEKHWQNVVFLQSLVLHLLVLSPMFAF